MIGRSHPHTLAAALPREIERVAKLIPIYRAVPLGFLAAGMMQRSLNAAQAAIAAADPVGMIRAYEDLKGYSL
ncbi:hypothetical protein [uncultured Methylobacterium sp.]|uniref:hypothetical protein n=1 Tax=uncultured Methylobacterium sp. TaxID=157278 RepID=UPI0035CC9DFA